MVWGRTKRKSDTNGYTRLSENEWIQAGEPTNDVLVSADEFNRVKRNFANNRITVAQNGKTTWLLNGLIFCGQCGSPMSGHTDCHTWKAYYCNTRKYKGKTVCDAPTLNVNYIEPYIEERVRQFVASIEDEPFFDSDHWKHDSVLVTNLKKEIARLENLVEKKDKAAEKVLSLFEVGDTAPEIVRSRLQKLENERNNLEEQVINRRGQLDDALKEIPTREELEGFARDFDEIWQVANIEEKKMIVQALIEKITVYPTGRIKVIFAF